MNLFIIFAFINCGGGSSENTTTAPITNKVNLTLNILNSNGEQLDSVKATILSNNKIQYSNSNGIIVFSDLIEGTYTIKFEKKIILIQL